MTYAKEGHRVVFSSVSTISSGSRGCGCQKHCLFVRVQFRGSRYLGETCEGGVNLSNIHTYATVKNCYDFHAT